MKDRSQDPSYYERTLYFGATCRSSSYIVSDIRLKTYSDNKIQHAPSLPVLLFLIRIMGYFKCTIPYGRNNFKTTRSFTSGMGVGPITNNSEVNS